MEVGFGNADYAQFSKILVVGWLLLELMLESHV